MFDFPLEKKIKGAYGIGLKSLTDNGCVCVYMHVWKLWWAIRQFF